MKTLEEIIGRAQIDAGRIAASHEERDEQARNERAARASRDRDARVRQSLSRVPERAAGSRFGATWPGSVDPIAARSAGRARGDNRPIVTLFGKSGTGKTTIAVAMLRDRLQRSPIGMFLEARSVIEAIRTAGRSESPTIAEALRVDSLALDDLGVEPGGEWSREITGIVQRRFDDGRWTLITTGIAIDTAEGAATISDRYGSGVLRRMLEGVMVRFDDR